MNVSPATRRRAAALGLAALLLIGVGRSSAAPLAAAFTYQGQLSQNGTPVEGVCDLQAGLFDAAAAGVQIGATQTLTAVPVTAGLFTVSLDFGPDAFPGAARWLEVSVRCPAGVGAYTPLLPRQAVTPAPYALHAATAGQVAWAGLTDLPPGFADGADADTMYTAGPGLVLTGTEFSLLFAGPGLAATAARSDHAHDERYLTLAAAGQQLADKAELEHTHLAGDLTAGVLAEARLPASMARVADLPAQLAAAGFITATLAEERYRYLAGPGLTLAGQTFQVDPAVTQARIAESCAPGLYLRAIAADGTVSCAADLDTNSGGTLTGLTAGAGLTGGGASGAVTLSADTAYLQRRVTGTCAAGQKLLAIAADGTVSCAADLDTNSGGTLTGLTAGAGLTGGGASGAVTLSADTAYLQRRVTGTCAAGQKLLAIAADGTVSCAADLDTNDTYAAHWAGLTGVPAGFADGVDQDTGAAAAQITLSAAQAIPSSSTWTKVAFDTAGLNNNSLFDLSNRRLTAPVSGRYWVSVRLVFEFNAASVRGVMLRKNAGGAQGGGALIGYDAVTAIGVSPWSTSVATEAVLWLNAGDTVEVFAVQQSGASLNLLTSAADHLTSFYAVWLP